MIHNQVKVKTILEAIFIITIMYAIVQFIQTVCYVSTQKGMIPVIVKDCVSILCFILFVAPVIIFILHTGFRNSRTFFLEFWRKHWIFYLFYIIVLFVIKKNIILGYYSVQFYMFGLSFGLNENSTSAFLMAYLYILFFSATSTLFFVLLPNYFLILFRKRLQRYEG